MIFIRSILDRDYNDYQRHRPRLRRDFEYRCAYCLTQEFFVGGEAGFEIDHYRPVRGQYGHPELVAVYSNLYWVCGECNLRKSDTWPTLVEEEAGMRFLDPCRSEDDHNLHWTFNLDGTIEAQTPVAEFTEEKLRLWREFLVQRRAQMFRDQTDIQKIELRLISKEVSLSLRIELQKRADDIRQRLDPPVINRPRRRI